MSKASIHELRTDVAAANEQNVQTSNQAVALGEVVLQLKPEVIADELEKLANSLEGIKTQGEKLPYALTETKRSESQGIVQKVLGGAHIDVNTLMAGYPAMEKSNAEAAGHNASFTSILGDAAVAFRLGASRLRKDVGGKLEAVKSKTDDVVGSLGEAKKDTEEHLESF